MERHYGITNFLLGQSIESSRASVQYEMMCYTSYLTMIFSYLVNIIGYILRDTATLLVLER